LYRDSHAFFNELYLLVLRHFSCPQPLVVFHAFSCTLIAIVAFLFTLSLNYFFWIALHSIISCTLLSSSLLCLWLTPFVQIHIISSNWLLYNLISFILMILTNKTLVTYQPSILNCLSSASNLEHLFANINIVADQQ
jgi:hypothetical protein